MNRNTARWPGFLILMVCLFVGSTFPAAATGLVNPSFETGTLSGWVGWPTPATSSVITTNTAHAGQAVARVQFNGLNTLIQDVANPGGSWVAGEAFTATAWFRYSTSKTSDYAAMTVHYMNTQGALQGPYLSTAGPSGNQASWQKMQIAFTAQNQATLRISLRGGSDNGVGVAWFDDLQIEPAAAIPPLDIYLLMGQSNMVGMDTNYVADDHVSHPRVYMLNASDLWVPALEPVHGVGVGPGLTFGKRMADRFPTANIGLVPLAVGSTPISQWVKGSVNYQATLARAAVARQHGVIKGILWHQGENDSYDAALAAAYPAQIEQLVRDLRSDLNSPALPFVCGELGRFLEADYRTSVSQALLALPARLPAVAAVESSGLTNLDAWHFDAPSQRIMGTRYYDAMVDLQISTVAAQKWRGY